MSIRKGNRKRRVANRGFLQYDIAWLTILKPGRNQKILTHPITYTMGEPIFIDMTNGRAFEEFTNG